jgi:hypothetical protein
VIFAGESGGESNFRQKTTFALKPMKLLAKVECESNGESGESGMSKYLKSLTAKAKVSPLYLRYSSAAGCGGC